MTARFLAVICGLKSEAAALRRAVASPLVRVGVSGASAERAYAIASALCREGAAAVVSLGVSGGLDPTLAPGDLLIGESVRTRLGESFEASPHLLAAMALEPAALAMRRAALYGSDVIIASAAEKRRLFEATGAAAVDMESHGAARAARESGVGFAALRAVADPASRALPAAALDAVTPDGGVKTLSVLARCAKAPGELPALMQLGADSEVALKVLRGGVGGLFGRLLLSLDL